MQPKYYGAAAEYNKPTGFQPNKRWLLIGGVVVLILTVLMVTAVIFSAITSGPSREVAILVTREGDLSTILDDNADRVRNGDLAKINAEATTLLLSDVGTLTEFMTSNYGIDEVPEDILAAETDTEVEIDLDDAEKIGRFDKVYADIMQTKVGHCIAQVEKVLAASNDEEFKTALEQNIENLKSIDDQLGDLKL